MRHDLTATDREALPGILAAVLEWPGTTNDELQQLLGHPQYRVRKVLAVLRRDGKLGLVRSASAPARWYPPAEAMVIRSAVEREAARKRRERNRVYSSRFNDKLRAGLLDDDDDDEGLPVRRIADAREPLPWRVNAVPSVFHLGAAA